METLFTTETFAIACAWCLAGAAAAWGRKPAVGGLVGMFGGLFPIVALRARVPEPFALDTDLIRLALLPVAAAWMGGYAADAVNPKKHSAQDVRTHAASARRRAEAADRAALELERRASDLRAQVASAASLADRRRTDRRAGAERRRVADRRRAHIVVAVERRRNRRRATAERRVVVRVRTAVAAEATVLRAAAGRIDAEIADLDRRLRSDPRFGAA